MPTRERQLSALNSLCGFWIMLESTAAKGLAPTSLHLLDVLRRGEGRDVEGFEELFRVYDLAAWIETETGIEIECAPMYARMIDNAGGPQFGLPVSILEKPIIQRGQTGN